MCVIYTVIMGMTKGLDQSDISVTISNVNPSASESAMTASNKDDQHLFGVHGAQSSTTYARSKETDTAVTYSNLVAYSSPGSVQLVDTNTNSSQPSVAVSQNLTRPPTSFSQTPCLLQALQSSPQHPQLQQYSQTPQKQESLLQHLTQTQPSQETLLPQTTHEITAPTLLDVHQSVQLVKIPNKVTQSQSFGHQHAVQNLQLNSGTQSQQSQPIQQHSSVKSPDAGYHHLSAVLQGNPIPDPVLIGLRNPSSTAPPVTTGQQSQLVKKLLIRNLYLLHQHQQQQKHQEIPQLEQKPSLLPTLQKLPHKKSIPTHTVQHEESIYSAIPGTDVPVPLKEPPPYHSLQCVPELPELSADQSSESGDLSPMRLGAAESSLPTGKMEGRLVCSLDSIINTCGDMPFSTEFLDASIYASSPNSIFMYEQEKMDMQSTLATACTSVDTSGITDDFELKSQYEISQDLSSNLPVCVTTIGDGGTFSMSKGGGCQMWGDDVKQSKEDVMIKPEIASTASTPTLAELNFNMDLLEDIENVISVDMNSTSSYTARDASPVIKQEADTAFIKGTVSTSSPSTPTYTKLLPVQSTLDSKTQVKTEPVDYDSKPETDQIALILQSMREWSKSKGVQQSENVQSSQRTLPTIKQLDLSDARTLRHLLVNEQPLTTERPKRKRTVSESATLKSASRKRSYPSAGLESMDRKWEEIKQFIHMDTPTEDAVPLTGRPPIKRERKRYDSECSAITLTSNEDEDSDSDRDIDFDSDSDLEDGHDIGSLNPAESLIGEKDKQYFWQYNVQSKGPKGTRAHFEMEEDPHVLNDFEDPVFDPTNSSLAGVGVSIKHGGKARKGDGNDIVPSPKKLCQIGLQLRKINRQINDFLPVSELPSSARNKSRKEKNKLASRACRLKKKAQHEANKVKLHGLEIEHRQLLTVIRHMRKKVLERLRTKVKKENQLTMTETLEQLIKEHLKIMIAGNTADYVNKVVHTVEEGDVSGGLKVLATRSYPKELHN